GRWGRAPVGGRTCLAVRGRARWARRRRGGCRARARLPGRCRRRRQRGRRATAWPRPGRRLVVSGLSCCPPVFAGSTGREVVQNEWGGQSPVDEFLRGTPGGYLFWLGVVVDVLGPEKRPIGALPSVRWPVGAVLS